jgi:uncharacterized damage-inducible protein DinB
MTVAEARQLFAYDDWANRRLSEALVRLTEEQLGTVVASSHPSLRETFAHIIFAEWIWLRRWLGESPTGAPSWVASQTVNQLQGTLSEVQSDRSGLLERLEDAGLDGLVRFRDTEGDEYTHALGDLMRHVVNHSSYHRGQAATQLRQLGEVPPGTDLVLYLLEKS